MFERNDRIMTDFETFLQDNSETIFRYFKYKKVWTPYELDKKFSDESIYENGGYAELAYIRQAIELPDGDILLKMEHTYGPDDIYDEDNDHNIIYEYVKLSEISLEEFSKDN